MSQSISRMTRQRRVIMEELAKVSIHPTADELYTMVRHKLPAISLGTVYRNLDLLSESKQIRKLEMAGTTRRFDADISPHQHVRCVKCGCVADVYTAEEAISFALKNVNVDKFIITNARIEYDGVCQECASTPKEQ